MNKLDVNQVGGLPLTTRILDELQKAFAVFNGLGAMAGNMTIISGCTVVGSTVTDGVVYVNGEVFEFRGGNTQTKVIIKEDTEPLVFENNESKTVIRTRYVTFGTGVGAMDWVDFKPLIEIKTLEATFAGINNSLSAIVSKLDTIDANAKVQVPTDWSASTGVSRLLNKPIIEESGILFSGTVLASGVKISFYKLDFTSLKLATGQHKITHGLGHTNYAVTGAGIRAFNMKVSLWEKTNDYFIVGVSDDSTLNDGDFSFLVFKTA